MSWKGARLRGLRAWLSRADGWALMLPKSMSRSGGERICMCLKAKGLAMGEKEKRPMSAACQHLLLCGVCVVDDSCACWVEFGPKWRARVEASADGNPGTITERKNDKLHVLKEGCLLIGKKDFGGRLELIRSILSQVLADSLAIGKRRSGSVDSEVKMPDLKNSRERFAEKCGIVFEG